MATRYQVNCCAIGQISNDASHENICANTGSFASLRACTLSVGAIQTNQLTTPSGATFPLAYAAYAGPEQVQVGVLPLSFMAFAIGAPQTSAFFALSDLNVSSPPQDVFRATGQTSTVDWVEGQTSVGGGAAGVQYLDSLAPGIYDVSFSLSFVHETENNASVVVAVGTHDITAGGTPFVAAGSPIPHPSLPGVFAVSAFGSTEDVTEVINLSARGSVVVGAPLDRFGLVAYVDKDGISLFGAITLTVTRIS